MTLVLLLPIMSWESDLLRKNYYKEMDTNIVAELTIQNFLNLQSLCNKNNSSPEDVLNKVIYWCYHSKYFWKELENICYE